MAYSNGYSYKRTVTLTGTQIAASVTNFPVLVKATLDASHVTTSSGYDIRFEDGSGTHLDHDVESYNPSTGALIAWVRIPALTASTDLTIDLYYGNAAVTTGTEQNAAGCWTAFAGVWFLSEAATGTSVYKDRTTAANHMSSVGSQLTAGVSGQISNALSRNGSTVEVSRAITDGNTTLAAGPLTVMCWGKSNADAQNGNAQLLWEETGGRFRYYSTGSTGRQWRVYKTSGTLASLTGTTADQSWHHLALRVGSSGALIYQDASQVTTNAVNSYIGTAGKVAVLSSSTANQGMNGAISHLMIAAADLGAGWVSTAYANQSAPGSFLTLGSEESGSTGPETHTGAGGPLTASVALGAGVGHRGFTVGASVSGGDVTLTWTDQGTSDGYLIERDGDVIATVTALTYTDHLGGTPTVPWLGVGSVRPWLGADTVPWVGASA